MLAVMGSVGVELEVNLRNPLHVDDRARKQGIHAGFETQGRSHQTEVSKREVSVTRQKGLISSTNLKRK